jgi:hypothetical protein
MKHVEGRNKHKDNGIWNINHLHTDLLKDEDWFYEVFRTNIQPSITAGMSILKTRGTVDCLMVHNQRNKLFYINFSTRNSTRFARSLESD